MRRGFVTFWIVCSAIFVSGQTNDWAQSARYARENAALMESGEEVPVVFYGNSITQMWYEAHPGFFLQNHFAGRGIGGQTSCELLVRFRQDVINLQPKKVVILAGINDIAENNGPVSLENILGNIVSMCELARANHITPILCSVLPARAFYWNPSIQDVPAKVQALNRLIRTYADGAGIPYVNYYDALADTDGGMKQGLSIDEVHPAPDTYTIMEEIVLPFLAQPAPNNELY